MLLREEGNVLAIIKSVLYSVSYHTLEESLWIAPSKKKKTKKEKREKTLQHSTENNAEY